MIKKKPKVSIIMAIHSGIVDEINTSVMSIINQTFDDFEFIIVDDINEINTSKYILSLSKKFNKIKILKNKINQGLTKSLVSAIEIANGKYIARQDADDISHPNRIYEQVKYLDKYNKVVLIGTGYSVINKQNKTVTEIVNSYNHKEICENMMKSNPFCHSSVMFRKIEYHNTGGYNPNFISTQDFDLWFRFMDYGEFALLNKNLVTRNITQNSISSNFSTSFQQATNGLHIRLREIHRWPRKKKIIKILTIYYVFFRSLMILIIPNKFIFLKAKYFKGLK